MVDYESLPFHTYLAGNLNKGRAPPPPLSSSADGCKTRCLGDDGWGDCRAHWLSLEGEDLFMKGDMSSRSRQQSLDFSWHRGRGAAGRDRGVDAFQ